jgi:hypothetical protein
MMDATNESDQRAQRDRRKVYDGCKDQHDNCRRKDQPHGHDQGKDARSIIKLRGSL